MLRYVFYCFVIFTLLINTAGCRDEEQKIIVLDDTPTHSETNKVAEQPKIRIAIGGIITPEAGLAYYHDLLDYLQDKIGMEIEYVDREDYAAINQLLKKGNWRRLLSAAAPM